MFDLEQITNPNFIKKLSKKELEILASDIRNYLIENITKTGGHLSSNLGVVELTIALHYCFDLENDKLIFDVSHQIYTHKILTGRAKEFHKLRKIDGLNGFSDPNESKYDVFNMGHSSTSISFQTGLILDNKEKKLNRYIVSVIGDASMSNGLAFEGLNHLGTLKNEKGIIILNDNKMGISKTTGAFSRLLSSLRLNKKYIKIKSFVLKISPKFMRVFFRKITRSIKGFIQYSNIFEDLGFRYIGPIDGHNINQMISYINRAKELNQPCVIHVLTKKGKGFKEAEDDTIGNYHGIDFSLKDLNKESFSEIVLNSLIKLQEENNKIFVVSSGMLNGSKLLKYQEKYKNYTIDVGIEEEHAATMSGALAKMNNNVFLSYYSTFSQRAFDEILQDIALQKVKIVIGLDRANLVGEDGYTHQGIYDISLFQTIPDIIITMPSNQDETYSLLKYGFLVNNLPLIIRYSKDKIVKKEEYVDEKYTKPFWKIEEKNDFKMIVICYGNAVNRIRNLSLDILLVNALFIKPIDKDVLNKLISYNMPILVYEEVVKSGNLYQMISSYIMENNISFNKLYKMCLPDKFIEFGSVSDLLEKYKLSDKYIIEKVNSLIGSEINASKSKN